MFVFVFFFPGVAAMSFRSFPTSTEGKYNKIPAEVARLNLWPNNTLPCSEASPTDGATGLRDHVTQTVIQVCKPQAHCLTASFAFHAAAVDFH